ncbi:hypothetical protein BTR23_10360 [Alkalihalophilus pseudofirmus]|nr:hypothetical protein BTR23_10360 [Alkalihalophilus pseudofirmus]
MLFRMLVLTFTFIMLITNPNNTVANVKPTTIEEEQAAVMYQLGEKVNVGGLDVTVCSFSLTEPFEGKNQLVLAIKIYNHSEESIEITPENLKLLNEQGFQQLRISNQMEENQHGIRMEPTSILEKDVRFIIDNTGTFEFIFENPYLNGRAKWEISLE